jgi:hypothetical protein
MAMRKIHPPVKAGDKVVWTDFDWYWLKRGEVYQVDAVSGYYFSILHCPVRWLWCNEQFRKVEV